MSAQQKPEPGTAVARSESPKGIIATLEQDRARSIIEPLLPAGVTFETVTREVYLASRKNPDILLCEVPSVISAVADAVRMGGVIGEDIHLVPFNVRVKQDGAPDRWEKRLQAIRDYKFKVELIIRTGAARSIDAMPVYEHEHFRYEAGLVPVLEHTPELNDAKRGAMIGAYAIARLSFGNFKIQWMSLAEIEAIRKDSKQWNPKKIAQCPDWYAIKTVIHRLAKLLPKNPRLAKLLQQFDAEDGREATLDDGPVAEIAPPATAQLAAPATPVTPVEAHAVARPEYVESGTEPVARPRPPAPENARVYDEEEELAFDRKLSLD